MFNMKKSASAVAAGLAVAFCGAAQASVLATSMIEMTNFVIRTAPAASGGVILTNGNQISLSNFSSNADQDVTLNSATPSSLSNTNPGTTSPAGIDFAPICVGNGCNLPGNVPIGSNTFPVLTGPTAINYAAADQLELGAPINLTGFTTGAHVANGSYVGIADQVTAGSANSNNGLNTQFIFVVTQSGTLTFEFDARAYMEAFVSGSEPFLLGTSADTSTKFGFQITEISSGNVVFDWKPDGTLGTITKGTENADPYSLNSNCAAQPAGVDFRNRCGVFAAGIAGNGFFSATTLGLTAGELYQLNAFVNTNVNAARQGIPEPATLALAGLGLLGLGVGRYRRRSK